MPIYEYLCPRCKKITTKIHKPNRIPNRVLCETLKCGRRAKRIIASSGAIKCDDAVNIPWLDHRNKNSAQKTLLRHGEPPLTTRGEYERYLKQNNYAPKA
jgi:putative FmdB family regulatory protein